MAEDKLKDLLQRTDRMKSDPIIDNDYLVAVVRHRASHRRIRNIAVAAMLMVAVGLFTIMSGTDQTAKDKDTIANLEGQVIHLQARTDTVLNFVHEVLEKEKRQDLLDKLHAQLASIPDPIEEVQKQTDKMAFGIIYHADHLYRELNLKSDAVERYNQVIKLFPENRWAKMAKQRLLEIENDNL